MVSLLYMMPACTSCRCVRLSAYLQISFAFTSTSAYIYIHTHTYIGQLHASGPFIVLWMYFVRLPHFGVSCATKYKSTWSQEHSRNEECIWHVQLTQENTRSIKPFLPSATLTSTPLISDGWKGERISNRVFCSWGIWRIFTCRATPAHRKVCAATSCCLWYKPLMLIFSQCVHHEVSKSYKYSVLQNTPNPCSSFAYEAPNCWWCCVWWKASHSGRCSPQAEHGTGTCALFCKFTADVFCSEMFCFVCKQFWGFSSLTCIWCLSCKPPDEAFMNLHVFTVYVITWFLAWKLRGEQAWVATWLLWTGKLCIHAWSDFHTQVRSEEESKKLFLIKWSAFASLCFTSLV